MNLGPFNLKMNKEKWLSLFEEERFIDTNDWRETIPALLILGALKWGASEKAKRKIMKWIGLEYRYGMKMKVEYFFRCWNRLEKNGIFKSGEVYADLNEETAEIEFALLISVAQGHTNIKGD